MLHLGNGDVGGISTSATVVARIASDAWGMFDHADAVQDRVYELHASQHLSTSFANGVLTARLAGPMLGQREASIVSGELNRVLEDCGSQLQVLVIDASDIEVMVSMGLGLCNDARNTARQFGAKTILHGLSDKLTELFKLMKLDRLYTITHSPEELSRALRRR